MSIDHISQHIVYFLTNAVTDGLCSRHCSPFPFPVPLCGVDDGSVFRHECQVQDKACKGGTGERPKMMDDGDVCRGIKTGLHYDTLMFG